MENLNRKRLAIGINPVGELLRSDNPVDRIYVSKNRSAPQIARLIDKAQKRDIPIIMSDNMRMDKLCDGANHQGIIAVCAEIAYCDVDDILALARSRTEKPFVIILDGLKDPHNFGAIIRSANGAGAHGIIVAKRGNAPLSETVSKTSAGALEYARIARVSNLASTIEELKEKGLWIFGTSDKATDTYTNVDFDTPCALIIGDEGFGIGRLLSEKCDFLINIPMKGQVSSLNASVAAGVVMYEVLRQRDLKTINGGE